MNSKNDIQIMLREGAVLAVITLIAGLLLGFVYELTKEPIRIQQEKAVKEACQEVFPGSNLSFQKLEYVLTEGTLAELNQYGVKVGTVFKVSDEEGICKGYVIQSISTRGYGGNIELYAGITIDGILNDISILTIAETPGLGMRAEEVLVPQFHGKQVESFTYTKTGSKEQNEIDAISGATVTTSAVTNAVNGALMVAEELKEVE